MTSIKSSTSTSQTTTTACNKEGMVATKVIDNIYLFWKDNI
jgi:hypothetical protein